MDTMVLERPKAPRYAKQAEPVAISRQRKRLSPAKVKVKVEKNADGDSREEIIANLTQAFKELQLYKQGKLKVTPAKDFFNEL